MEGALLKMEIISDQIITTVEVDLTTVEDQAAMEGAFLKMEIISDQIITTLEDQAAMV